jgi:hypothetical protein
VAGLPKKQVKISKAVGIAGGFSCFCGLKVTAGRKKE